MVKLLQCSPGNKRCGKRCVPTEHKCAGEGEESSDKKSISTSSILAAAGVIVGVSALGFLAYQMHSGKATNTQVDKEWEAATKVAKKTSPEPPLTDDLSGIVDLKLDRRLGTDAILATMPDGKGASVAAQTPDQIKGYISQQYGIDEGLIGLAVKTQSDVRISVPPPNRYDEFLKNLAPEIRSLVKEDSTGVAIGSAFIVNPRASNLDISSTLNKFIVGRVIAQSGKIPHLDIRASTLPQATDKNVYNTKVVYPSKAHKAMMENVEYFAAHPVVFGDYVEKSLRGVSN